MAMKERKGRSRVSKADQVVNKLDSATSAHNRVRPTSKADEISKKIPEASAAAAPTRIRPSSKADDISRKIPAAKPAANPRPVNPAPQQASSRVVVPPVPVSKPTAKKRSGCCLLPFTLAIAVIIPDCSFFS